MGARHVQMGRWSGAQQQQQQHGAVCSKLKCIPAAPSPGPPREALLRLGCAHVSKGQASPLCSEHRSSLCSCPASGRPDAVIVVQTLCIDRDDACVGGLIQILGSRLLLELCFLCKRHHQGVYVSSLHHAVSSQTWLVARCAVGSASSAIAAAGAQEPGTDATAPLHLHGFNSATAACGDGLPGRRQNCSTEPAVNESTAALQRHPMLWCGLSWA
jgi:hypothetical protein